MNSPEFEAYVKGQLLQYDPWTKISPAPLREFCGECLRRRTQRLTCCAIRGITRTAGRESKGKVVAAAGRKSSVAIDVRILLGCPPVLILIIAAFIDHHKCLEHASVKSLQRVFAIPDIWIS